MAILNIGIKISGGSSSTGSGTLLTMGSSQYAEVTTVMRSSGSINVSGQSIPVSAGRYKYTVPPGASLSITGTHGTSWAVFVNTQ